MTKRPTIRGSMKKGRGAATYLQDDTPKVKPKKSTLYFAPEVQQALEELWLSVRRTNRIPPDKKRVLSRSDIVSAAIERTTEHLKTLPPDTQFELLFTPGKGLGYRTVTPSKTGT